MKSDLEDGELEEGELDDQEEDVPVTPPAAPEIPAPSARTPSPAFKESREEISTKVLINVATKVSTPPSNSSFHLRVEKMEEKMGEKREQHLNNKYWKKSLIAMYVDHDRLGQNAEYYNYGNATATWSRASNPSVTLENNMRDNEEDDFTSELRDRKEQSGLKGPYDSPSDDDDLDDEDALQSMKIRACNGESSTSNMDGWDRASLDCSGGGLSRKKRLNKNRNNKKRQQKLMESLQSINQPAEGGKKQKRDKFTDCEKQSKKLRLADTPWEERPQCKFYMEGKCSKGSDCPFNHSGKPEKQKLPCKQFHRTGTCHYGDNCKYSHSPIREEFGKTPVLANGVGDGDHSAPKKRTLLDGPQPENKKKIPSLFDFAFISDEADPDKQKSIQRTLKEAAQKSIYGPTKHPSPVMRQHIPQDVRKPGLLGVAPKNMMGPGSMMSAARSMPFGFPYVSGPSNRHGDFCFQNSRMFNFNEKHQQPDLFGINRVSNNSGWQQQQQQPLFSEHPTIPQNKDQNEEMFVKVDENAAQPVSYVDKMKPIQQKGQQYLGGFDLYSLPPAQLDLQRSIYQQPKNSPVDASTKMEEKSRTFEHVNNVEGDKWYSNDDENICPARLVIGTDVDVPVASVPVASVSSSSQSFPANIMNLFCHSMQTSTFSQPAFDIMKLLSTVYQNTENVGHQELEVNGSRVLNLPYRLQELTVDRTIRLPLFIDLNDPKWENDPRVQKRKNYRLDPRLRKKATPSAAAQSSGELENRQEKSSPKSEQPSSTSEVETAEAEVGKKSLRDMNKTEFRSPLMQMSSEGWNILLDTCNLKA